MKYHLMQPVVITSDTLRYDLPVGEPGYIVMVEPRMFIGIPYLVRVPSKQTEYWVPECDLASASQWIAQESEKVIRDSLIDFALKTGNKTLFESQSDTAKGAVSREKKRY